jgi:hypothetical protein
MLTTSPLAENTDNRGNNGPSSEGESMSRTTQAEAVPEEVQAPAPLTDEQLHALYADPHDIIPPHTLDELVAGMKRELGTKTGYAQENVSEELIQPRGNNDH